VITLDYIETEIPFFLIFISSLVDKNVEFEEYLGVSFYGFNDQQYMPDYPFYWKVHFYEKNRLNH